MPFIPHTHEDIQSMLDAIGVDDINQLFDEIPDDLKIAELQNVPEQMNEMQVSRFIKNKARINDQLQCFAGAGAYEHHIPAAIWQLATRGEFYTAYTPYQAEVSQGSLQVIYEFQTMITKLTGMEVSNASLYDGASALAEAALMAVRANRKSKSKVILVPKTVNPVYREVLNNIVHNQDIKVIDVDYDKTTGKVNAEHLAEFDSQDITALVIPQPNHFGIFEDIHNLANWAYAKNTFAIAVVNPTSLALLTAPGDWGEHGVDICIGEGQPLGIPLSSGGPYFGFMTSRQKYIRQMPGRIVGQTTDLDNKIGYTLAFQAREQHIRRAKATSNICTNQGLMVTAATIYMALLGEQGLRNIATTCMQNTAYLRQKLQDAGIKVCFDSPNFHELVIQTRQDPQVIIGQLAKEGIVAGVNLSKHYLELGNAMSICVTETKTKADIDAYVQALLNA
ncbi:Glycine dehydrogenase [decarboxylating] (glycine cleavage system P1 protein) [hydrothermal vent metagenome]|uniref:glycine dehydrogenase (aminomethyl-transferring) n=1 Tax=hydrothermal vent metagenome TaxID=652676 RepID=A0A3B0VB30_9ZZZZ